jgi:hypothetical protein
MHITTIVLDLNIAHARDAIWFVGKGFADSATLIAVKAAMLCQLATGRYTDVALRTVLVSA